DDAGGAEGGADGAVPAAVRAGGVRRPPAGQPGPLPRRPLPPRAAQPPRPRRAVAADPALLGEGVGGPAGLLGLPYESGPALPAADRPDGHLHGHVPALLQGARGRDGLGPLAGAAPRAAPPAGPGRAGAGADPLGGVGMRGARAGA